MAWGLAHGRRRAKNLSNAAEGTPDHFDKLFKGSCPSHAFPVKHLYKECTLIKWFLFGGSDKGNQRKKPEPAADDAKGKDGGFLTQTAAS